MMRPHPFAIIAGASACDRKNGAARLIARTASQSAMVTSSIGLRMLMPAALTTISGAPKNDAARSAAARSASRSARSAVSVGRACARLLDFALRRCKLLLLAARPTRPRRPPRPAHSQSRVRCPSLRPSPGRRRPPRSKRAGAVTTRCARRARSARRENTSRAGRRRCARALPFLRAARCARWPARSCGWPRASCAATSPS